MHPRSDCSDALVVTLVSPPSRARSVVKSRLDTCAKLQPKNPTVYKLRGDWVGCHFPLHANKAACKADFERAIRLCEEHPDGSNLNTHGADRAAQRSYTLAFCHFKLGEIAQHA
jgi:hypothetical protein